MIDLRKREGKLFHIKISYCGVYSSKRQQQLLEATKECECEELTEVEWKAAHRRGTNNGERTRMLNQHHQSRRIRLFA